MTNSKLRKSYYLPFLCLIILMLFCLCPPQGLAANDLSLKADMVLAQPGSEVNVPILINSNPGIASLKFSVQYDSTSISLLGVSFPKNAGTYTCVPEPYSDSQIINFISPTVAFDQTGLFATLTFLVNQDAEVNTVADITIVFEEEDIFDASFNSVPLAASNGSVTITDENVENVAKLPSSLVKVEEKAFMNTTFSYIYLPETIAEIGSKAFADCSNLRYIYIPESTVTIAEDAFLNVANLVISGKDGSYAEEFAINHGFEFQAR